MLRAVRAAGGKPAEAVRLAIKQGWTTINLEWLKNAGMTLADAPTDEADEWADRLKVWREDRTWSPAWGPKPDEPKCRAPAELLRAA